MSDSYADEEQSYDMPATGQGTQSGYFNNTAPVATNPNTYPSPYTTNVGGVAGASPSLSAYNYQTPSDSGHAFGRGTPEGSQCDPELRDFYHHGPGASPTNTHAELSTSPNNPGGWSPYPPQVPQDDSSVWGEAPTAPSIYGRFKQEPYFTIAPETNSVLGLPVVSSPYGVDPNAGTKEDPDAPGDLEYEDQPPPTSLRTPKRVSGGTSSHSSSGKRRHRGERDNPPTSAPARRSSRRVRAAAPLEQQVTLQGAPSRPVLPISHSDEPQVPFESRTIASPLSAVGIDPDRSLHIEITTIRPAGTDLREVQNDVEECRRRFDIAQCQGFDIIGQTSSHSSARLWNHAPPNSIYPSTRRFSVSQRRWQEDQAFKLRQTMNNVERHFRNQDLNVELRTENEATDLRNESFRTFGKEELQILVHCITAHEAASGKAMDHYNPMEIEGEEEFQ